MHVVELGRDRAELGAELLHRLGVGVRVEPDVHNHRPNVAVLLAFVGETHVRARLQLEVPSHLVSETMTACEVIAKALGLPVVAITGEKTAVTSRRFILANA